MTQFLKLHSLYNVWGSLLAIGRGTSAEITR